GLDRRGGCRRGRRDRGVRALTRELLRARSGPRRPRRRGRRAGSHVRRSSRFSLGLPFVERQGAPRGRRGEVTEHRVPPVQKRREAVVLERVFAGDLTAAPGFIRVLGQPLGFADEYVDIEVVRTYIG